MDNVEAPVDKNGFTMKPPITDKELIILCLKNAPEGVDRAQLKRVLDSFTEN